MTDTKELLKKISALRQRLDQAQGLAYSATTTLLEQEEQPSNPLQSLQDKVESGAWENFLLDSCMRQIPDIMPAPGENPPLPALLTARAMRLVKRGKELLEEMRGLAEDPRLQQEDSDSLRVLHREIVAMTDAVLRTVQAFPPAPSSQMRLCEGLEGILAGIDEKLSILKSGLNLRGKEINRINFLAEILIHVLNGSPAALTPLQPLAAEIVSDARQGLALRFLHASPQEPARFVAAHSLTVAQVLARLLLQETSAALSSASGGEVWNEDRLEEAMLVALLHDVGMLKVPVEVLARPGPLDDDQRRLVERHPEVGAEIAAQLWPGGGWPVEAIADHHERLDGTGYPRGRNDLQLAPFPRLLAVCDIYAALCCPRPQRPALDSRTALTDTLLLADQGVLDRFQAERLLTLSFFPVGSVVELSDGSLGVVVAVNPCQRPQNHPAKPVVALLTDPQGLPLPIPRHLDLAQDDNRSVLRNLPAADRRHLLLKRYPELV